MASIIKRKNSFSVVYTYKDEDGKTKQKWETFKTQKEAKNRKIEIESSLNNGSFILPNKVVVSEFLNDYVKLYGEQKWGVKMYDSCCSIIKNYINPIIGDEEIQTITPRTVALYIKELQKTKSVINNNAKPKSEYVSPNVIEKIIKLLRHAFKVAVTWEIISKNPFTDAIIPTVEHKEREVLNFDETATLLNKSEFDRLYISLNLAIACSLRLGEILGSQWEKANLTKKAIANDNAYIDIDVELARVSIEAMERLEYRGIHFVFPSFVSKTKTNLVLKDPKTKSSVRRVWIPKTLAYILLEWKEKQDKQKEFLGADYHDYGLIIALEDGRPCEHNLILKDLKRQLRRHNLKQVVFHSFRHFSTTYKLKLNNGDIKATQGDTGHATSDMLMNVYARIVDEDRKINAQKFDSAFYNNFHLNNTIVQNEDVDEVEENNDLKDLLEELEKSPELVKTLRKMIMPKR